ncbi:Multidrug resistance protein MdtB [Sulfitobacter sp. DSM 110093]|uniref:efflux RND transporter permease subunit n=1 Tax=Sulfitobacter sp. DSM 110093 TaxID=2883127 RepID=UPI001FAD85ED|nr:efflux RND transporter permease subunit [Sulfitobacter sp. DSM 110093]UOA32726.1 Multidrug resistance protein MdtB [Sulfitobacter sp. DSM 110093]
MSDPAPKAGFSSLFVKRPVLAVVLNLLIIIAGAAAYLGVDIREMPNVDQPVLSVRTTYENAAPETVDTEVTAVLEDALSALEGVEAISSQSSFGSSRITLELSSSVDINTASNEAREIVAGLSRQLPDDLEPEVSKNDADADPIIRIALYGTASLEDLSRLAEDRVATELGGIDGIATVEVAGTQEYEYLVRLNMTALTGRGLTVEDVSTALAQLDNSAALGTLESADQKLTLKLASEDVLVEDIASLRIDKNTRLSDVALVQLTAVDRTVFARVNEQAAVAINVYRQSVANTLTISQDVAAALADLQLDMPDGVQMVTTADDGIYVEQALNEVVSSILLAVVIVVLVLYAFLRSWRAVLIPALTIPVALIGTLAAIWMAGFSVNTITLLALVLATGMVVDDAIVVVENVVRKRQEGLGRYAAAAEGANEVFFAVISTTATLAAVFIPISFLPGQAGGIFLEFGFVLAFCVTISSFVALTLVPMLAAFLDPGRTGESVKDGAEGDASLLGRGLLWLVDRALALPILVVALALCFGVFSISLYGSLNSALTPTEDRGAFMVRARAPSGVSSSFTDQQVQQIESMVAPYVESGEVAAVQSIVGLGGGTSAFVIVKLADWAERGRSQEEIMAELNREFQAITGLTVFARSPNSLGIRGGGSGLTAAVTGTNPALLTAQAEKLVAAMQAQPALFSSAQLSEEAYVPEIEVTIDADLAREYGLTPSEIDATISAMTAGVEAAEVFLNGEEITVQVEPGGRPINDPADLNTVSLRGDTGSFLPLSSVAQFEQVAGLSRVSREEGNRAVAVQAALPSGVDMGEAAAALEELARDELDEGVTLVFTGEAASLETAENGIYMVFAIAFVIVLLVLSAQFESLISAAVIMLAVPFGLGAAVVAIAVTGGSLNYYSQIGLVLLVGIMAKNGILIVEFANQLREAGATVDAAIRSAMRLRLRPVMMTMVSTVLGGVPLIAATGAGAEARIAVGWVIVGGLGFATVFTLFLTPVLYRILAPLAPVPGAPTRQLEQELAAA